MWIVSFLSVCFPTKRANSELKPKLRSREMLKPGLVKNVSNIGKSISDNFLDKYVTVV